MNAVTHTAAETPALSGAEVVLRALKDQGVEVIFGYPGGAVLPIYDALFQQNHIRHILVRHEQAAVHAAEGYARSTGKVGVVLVTSGPGATNAVTGLVDALMDSIPVVCLTGQVPTHLIGNDAFQEADTTGITRPATKHNYLVKRSEDLARVMHEAFHVARSGRPGPVVIDLPKDILIGKAPYREPSSEPHRSYRPRTEPDPEQIRKAVALLKGARRPVIYTGGGVVNSGPEASVLLTQFVRMTGFPCTNTLMGLGCFPYDDPQFLGMLGMHGTYEANLAMHGCDVMLNIGARFDDRVTGRLNAFSPGSKKIHADIDPSSINKNVKVEVPIVGDAAAVLRALIAAWKADPAQPDREALAAWWRQIDQWRAKDCLAYRQEGPVIKPQHAVKRLFEITRELGRDTFITTEVGQHQMWAAQYFGFSKPNRWMTSGGLGTMGYGLPAAMGVQIAHPDALVIDIAGEASILMNIQEMGTLAQYRLPVKVFILNNEYMGMVRQWQELL
ncbi:MAG: biosynthetic-type acetolactate synthase large subunit, partial [Acetobacteraceae bacterium]